MFSREVLNAASYALAFFFLAKTCHTVVKIIKLWYGFHGMATSSKPNVRLENRVWMLLTFSRRTYARILQCAP